MSKKGAPTRASAMTDIRGWSVQDVAAALQRNNLSACIDFFKKKEIDGENFLDLTEVQIALWKKELGLSNTRILSRLLDNIRKEPENYVSSNPTHQSTGGQNYYVKREEMTKASSVMPPASSAVHRATTPSNGRRDWTPAFPPSSSVPPVKPYVPQGAAFRPPVSRPQPASPSTLEVGVPRPPVSRPQPASPSTLEVGVPRPPAGRPRPASPSTLEVGIPRSPAGRPRPASPSSLEVVALRSRHNSDDSDNSSWATDFEDGDDVGADLDSEEDDYIESNVSEKRGDNDDEDSCYQNYEPKPESDSEVEYENFEMDRSAQADNHSPEPPAKKSPSPPPRMAKPNLPARPTNLRFKGPPAGRPVVPAHASPVALRQEPVLPQPPVRGLERSVMDIVKDIRIPSSIGQLDQYDFDDEEYTSIDVHGEELMGPPAGNSDMWRKLAQFTEPQQPPQVPSGPRPSAAPNQSSFLHQRSAMPQAPPPAEDDSTATGYDSDDYYTSIDISTMPESENYLEPSPEWRKPALPSRDASPGPEMPLQPPPIQPKAIVVLDRPNSVRKKSDETSRAALELPLPTKETPAPGGLRNFMNFKFSPKPFESEEKNASPGEMGVSKKLPLPVSPTSSVGGQLPPRPLPPPPGSSTPPLRQPQPVPVPTTPAPEAPTGQRRHQRAPPPPGNLQSAPWFHDVDRRRALESLRASGRDGCFMVRPSSLTNNPLTLTLLFMGRVYNISLRVRPDGLYALGTEKRNEKVFSSVEELIENYRSEKLVLYSNNEKTGRTVLTVSPDRPRPRARPTEPS